MTEILYNFLHLLQFLTFVTSVTISYISYNFLKGCKYQLTNPPNSNTAVLRKGDALIDSGQIDARV